MKKIVFLPILLLLFTTGCEILEEFDYVVVNVTGNVQVGYYDFENSKWGDVVNGEAVEMKLIKAGGERIEDIGTTGGGDGITSISGVFNLYKEQPIELQARLVSNPMIFASEKIEWAYVDKNRRYGGKNQPDICNADMFIALKKPIN